MSGGPRRTPEETKTASDYRRTKAPRGLLHARARRAVELVQREGLDRHAVAERMGVAKGTIDAWMAAARDERRAAKGDR